jgi:GNAT superfamily N-acetyltransferase
MDRIVLETSYTDAITEVFNDAFYGEFILDSDVVRQNIFDDENHDPEGCLGVVQNGHLAGFIVCKYYRVSVGSDGYLPEIGWISCLAVRKEFQGQGIGSQLLAWGEEFLKSRGRHMAKLGGDYKRFFAGFPDNMQSSRKFFENRGYTPAQKSCDLINKGEILTAGYKTNYNVEYREMRKEDTEGVKEFFTRLFTGRWGYLVTRYVDTCPDRLEDVFLALDKGKVIGFAKIYDWKSPILGPSTVWRQLLEPKYGGLGPIGVDDTYRGQNIGITLLLEALKNLRERGAGPIVIDATHLLDFYAKLGFSPWIVHSVMTKSL